MLYDPTNSVKFVGFNVRNRRYSQIRACMCEMTGQSDTALLRALKQHGIEFDSLKEDPIIYFITHEEQLEEFKKAKIKPTWAQLIGTSPCFSLDHDDCAEKFKRMMA